MAKVIPMFPKLTFEQLVTKARFEWIRMDEIPYSFPYLCKKLIKAGHFPVVRYEGRKRKDFKIADWVNDEYWIRKYINKSAKQRLGFVRSSLRVIKNWYGIFEMSPPQEDEMRRARVATKGAEALSELISDMEYKGWVSEELIREYKSVLSEFRELEKLE